MLKTKILTQRQRDGEVAENSKVLQVFGVLRKKSIWTFSAPSPTLRLSVKDYF